MSLTVFYLHEYNNCDDQDAAVGTLWSLCDRGASVIITFIDSVFLSTRMIDCHCYLCQVNGANGEDNVFIRCLCVCLCICPQWTSQSDQLALNANSSKSYGLQI